MTQAVVMPGMEAQAEVLVRETETEMEAAVTGRAWLIAAMGLMLTTVVVISDPRVTDMVRLPNWVRLVLVVIAAGIAVWFMADTVRFCIKVIRTKTTNT